MRFCCSVDSDFRGACGTDKGLFRNQNFSRDREQLDKNYLGTTRCFIQKKEYLFLVYLILQEVN